jgi:hypothetical protein
MRVGGLKANADEKLSLVTVQKAIGTGAGLVGVAMAAYFKPVMRSCIRSLPQ